MICRAFAICARRNFSGGSFVVHGLAGTLNTRMGVAGRGEESQSIDLRLLLLRQFVQLLQHVSCIQKDDWLEIEWSIESMKQSYSLL